MYRKYIPTLFRDDAFRPLHRYTLGFLFNSADSFAHVLLVEKERPVWQLGSYNGLGGKIESGETSLECIQREGREEAGVSPNWKLYGVIYGPDYSVDLYRATDYDAFLAARKQKDDGLELQAVSVRGLSAYPLVRYTSLFVDMALNVPPDSVLETYEHFKAKPVSPR